MPETEFSIFDDSARSEWMRVRTLINLRWMAIFGQTIALIAGVYVLELDLKTGLCVVAIGASVMFNLVETFVLPENKRLTQQQATLTLLFDLSQLLVLLYLNGGLNNPFAVLILAPVTISATALDRKATLLVGGVALAAISLLAVFHVPLRTIDGTVLALPELFLLGTWVSLVIGVVFVSAYARRVSIETFSMSQALAATQTAMGREHELAMLGGVVAAAAHEMGTPLATIKLVSSELAQELEDMPELKEDALLIQSQAERLRDILRDMGRSGKEDMHIKAIPLTTLIHMAAEPHENRGKTIVFLVNGELDDVDIADVPHVQNNPEIVHGIRNLVQNAVDFSASTVWVQSTWSKDSIRILVGDDGRGYPSDLLGKIGDPYLSKRQANVAKSTPGSGYEGMGLGLFIAKTLLERTGAQLTFANAALDGQANFASKTYLRKMQGATGAIVIVRWARKDIEVSKSRAVGPNPRIEI